MLNIGQTQHHERTRGVLGKASVAHHGKAPEPLDHGKDVFDLGADLKLVVILGVLNLVDHTTPAHALVGKVLAPKRLRFV